MKSTSCQIAKEKVFLIRLDRGEEIVTSLLKFIQEKKLKGGFLFGIGAVDKTKLAHYSVSKKRYTEKEFLLPLELTSLQGDLAFLKGKPLLHLHATFAKKDFSLLGGHLIEARIPVPEKSSSSLLPKNRQRPSIKKQASTFLKSKGVQKVWLKNGRMG